MWAQHGTMGRRPESQVGSGTLMWLGRARRTGAHAGTYRMQYVGEYARWYGRERSGMGRAEEVYGGGGFSFTSVLNT